MVITPFLGIAFPPLTAPNAGLNRKDAIVDSFDLDPRDPQSFAPSWNETPNEIQITVHRKTASGDGQYSKELLGYIRFDKKAGSLELANFKNRFEMSYLGLGGTTKRGHNKFAGVHGEGLKLATLVMHRNNHAYSLLKSEPLFRDLTSPVGEDMAAGDRIELLLHFTLPESLGTRHDSEVIKIDDIIEVCRFPRNFEVVHCVQPPPDAVESRTPFCRFAHSVIDEAITVMPLASELLPRRDRIRQDSFAEVSVLSVVDLTPNVLGPLEGFTDIADMGYRVLAGVGFKEDRHSTWRVRYPECKIFDESPQGIFGDFASGKLVPPGLPPPGNPMIALVAGENTNFRLSQGNKDMPSVDLFLSPLGIMDSATSSHFKPDFTALQISPAVLHSSTIRRFSESILRLLEQGQTVRISLQSLQAHGIPQDRSILVVVGSPFPGSAHVSTKRHDPPAIATGATRSQSPGKIEAFIGDLAFENPRATEGAGGTFVCSQADGAGMPPRYIYNHGTGQHVPGEDAKAVDMDADTVVLSYNSSQSLIHPVRRDLLTVRELARLQGFKDDFVFYGSPESQRKDVLAAQPPAVAKAIAKTILGVVMLSRKVELGDGGGNSRANKRPRVETD